MYEYDDVISYEESIDYIGDRGGYLAPDECRYCYKEKNEIVRNCPDHDQHGWPDPRW
jgi:hypothetical protein